MSEWVPHCCAAEDVAKKITENKGSQLAKYCTITEYVSRCFVYDYIRAIKTAKQKNVFPDVERTWILKMGICQDIAAMTVGMLRAIGIHAELCIGTTGGRKKHAWVETDIDGKKYRYDFSGRAKKYIVERRY